MFGYLRLISLDFSDWYIYISHDIIHADEATADNAATTVGRGLSKTKNAFFLPLRF